MIKIDFQALFEPYCIFGIYSKREYGKLVTHWHWRGWFGNVNGKPIPWHRCWKW